MAKGRECLYAGQVGSFEEDEAGERGGEEEANHDDRAAEEGRGGVRQHVAAEGITGSGTDSPPVECQSSVSR